jgi:hypothetical protein
MGNKEQNTGMSLQECKDSVSMDTFYLKWNEITDEHKIMLINQVAELYASQPINSGWVSVDIANKILKARDAFVEDDYDEVYHQLCLIADPNLSSINHWGELEEIASGLIKPH